MSWGDWARLGWDWEPSVVAGCALWLLACVGAARSQPWWRTLALFASDAVLLFALVSPLDTLADHYLFSAHMAQHLLLLELVPPLLLLGFPPLWARRLLQWRWAASVELRLRRPWIAWTIGFGTLCVWHLPRLYDAAVRYEGIHIVEHLLFLVSATIFWWPVLGPLPDHRMPVWQAIFYLFSRMSANLILGILVALAPVGFYTAYAHPSDALGLLTMIRRQWGLTPLLDQRLGGMLMWVPSLVIDGAAVPLLLALWGAAGEHSSTGARDQTAA
ncbi:MAG TPA: cytochrome c oxidase assembly protein [Terriglobales bacterium]|nr:cytochrome c oxidase assembly protein [Terriglobales bacterium]